MSSIYQMALGAEFEKLHPRIKKRFGFTSGDHVMSLGTGIMQNVWHGRIYTLPFLMVGSWRNIMFPERGTDVPFTVENYAYLDSLGRETVTWLRTFKTKRQRRFDAYMIYSQSHAKVVDYLGTHQHLAVSIDMTVDDEGGLRLRSGGQRFYEGPLAFRFPMLFSGIANVREWYDEATSKFQIEVNVHNRVWGPLFGYRGSFDVEWRDMPPHQIPDNVKPVRDERRE